MRGRAPTFVIVRVRCDGVHFRARDDATVQARLEEIACAAERVRRVHGESETLSVAAAPTPIRCGGTPADVAVARRADAPCDPRACVSATRNPRPAAAADVD